MRFAAMFIALAALCLPAFAAAQEPTPTLSIRLGETVTARVADGGAGFVELSRSRGEPEGEVPSGAVRFTFSDMAGMRMLHTENGYDRAFDYRARMFAGRRSANTSICTVLPGIAGFETWGDPIDRLELREPTLAETETSGITCR